MTGMSPSPPEPGAAVDHQLRLARVLRVAEDRCEVIGGDGAVSVTGFAGAFPTPHIERVSPGHLVALATRPGARARIVWRWYDAVVIAEGDEGTVPLWEPAHGEVEATPRPGYRSCEPGERAYASAGLPGAAWWVTGRVGDGPGAAAAELDEVDALYRQNDLWPTVFPEHEED